LDVTIQAAWIGAGTGLVGAGFGGLATFIAARRQMDRQLADARTARDSERADARIAREKERAEAAAVRAEERTEAERVRAEERAVATAILTEERDRQLKSDVQSELERLRQLAADGLRDPGTDEQSHIEMELWLGARRLATIAMPVYLHLAVSLDNWAEASGQATFAKKRADREVSPHDYFFSFYRASSTLGHPHWLENSKLTVLEFDFKLEQTETSLMRNGASRPPG